MTDLQIDLNNPLFCTWYENGVPSDRAMWVNPALVSSVSCLQDGKRCYRQAGGELGTRPYWLFRIFFVGRSSSIICSADDQESTEKLRQHLLQMMTRAANREAQFSIVNRGTQPITVTLPPAPSSEDKAEHWFKQTQIARHTIERIRDKMGFSGGTESDDSLVEAVKDMVARQKNMGLRVAASDETLQQVSDALGGNMDRRMMLEAIKSLKDRCNIDPCCLEREIDEANRQLRYRQDTIAQLGAAVMGDEYKRGSTSIGAVMEAIQKLKPHFDSSPAVLGMQINGLKRDLATAHRALRAIGDAFGYTSPPDHVNPDSVLGQTLYRLDKLTKELEKERCTPDDFVRLSALETTMAGIYEVMSSAPASLSLGGLVEAIKSLKDANATFTVLTSYEKALILRARDLNSKSWSWTEAAHMALEEQGWTNAQAQREIDLLKKDLADLQRFIFLEINSHPLMGPGFAAHLDLRGRLEQALREHPEMMLYYNYLHELLAQLEPAHKNTRYGATALIDAVKMAVIKAGIRTMDPANRDSASATIAEQQAKIGKLREELDQYKVIVAKMDEGFKEYRRMTEAQASAVAPRPGEYWEDGYGKVWGPLLESAEYTGLTLRCGNAYWQADGRFNDFANRQNDLVKKVPAP